MRICTRVTALAGWFVLAASTAIGAQSGPLPFRTAVELALKNSSSTAIGRAETLRAKAGLAQSRDPR